MPTPLPRWFRNRVLRHRARGTSDTVLRHIFRAAGPRPLPGEREAAAPSNVVAFRPLDAPGARTARTPRPRARSLGADSPGASSAGAVARAARDAAARR